MDRMDFLVPIHVGELVTFSASVNAAWRTSMEVGVRVEAENPLTGEVRHTNTAYLTMVALDDEGRPAPVPPLLATTPDRAAADARGRAAPRQPAAPSASRSSHAREATEARSTDARSRAGVARLEALRVAVISGRQRGPLPGPCRECGSPSAEVSKRIPAISTNAWPGFV